MGLFNNYNKPGKGVSKNERQKNVVARYFELYFRKFWSLCVLNIMFAIILAVFVALSVGVYSLVGHGILASTENYQLRLVISLFPFAFFGPVLAGALRITRDFVREEPVFMAGDFISTIKKNLKQTTVFSIISYIAAAAFSYAIPAYYYLEGFTKYILFPLAMIAALVFLFSQYYYYIMAVTCNLTVKQLIKNSVILSLACFLRNLILTAIIGVVLVALVAMAIYGIATPILFAIVLMLVVFFALGFLLYSVSFFAFPAIKKYIIDPYYEENPERTSIQIETDDKTDSYDENIEAQEEPKSEYVYHNGRMIHRSVLEEDALFDDSLNYGRKNND